MLKAAMARILPARMRRGVAGATARGAHHDRQTPNPIRHCRRTGLHALNAVDLRNFATDVTDRFMDVSTIRSVREPRIWNERRSGARRKAHLVGGLQQRKKAVGERKRTSVLLQHVENLFGGPLRIHRLGTVYRLLEDSGNEQNWRNEQKSQSGLHPICVFDNVSDDWLCRHRL